MATFRIFKDSADTSEFEVWLTDGLLQFVVNGEIRHDIDSVEDFLIAAAKVINKPNSTDDSIVESSGSIADKAVENFEEGTEVTLDTGGTNPTISLQDDDTEVRISGSGVGGSLRIDFGTGTSAQSEASQFLSFAENLLGKATTTFLEELTGVQIGDYTRTVTVSTRDDDIRQIKFTSTGETKDLSWADIYIEDLAAQYGGTKIQDGNVNDLSYNAGQLKFVTGDPTNVDLGSSGVGGKEVYDFSNSTDAQNFFDAMKAAFGTGSDRGDVINAAMEIIAAGLGGTQTKNGNVAVSYEARQIGLVGDKTVVDLGSQGVGGKEQYQFADQKTAQEYIDLVRDAVGVAASEGSLVEEFVYKVSGGAGISGSPTFVSKDAFVEFIGDEFGGTLKKDGAVSESFDGGAKTIAGGTCVKLGPSGVGGTEMWDFDSEATANAFIATLDHVFG